MNRSRYPSMTCLLGVTHEFINPEVSRSGLSRCLRRHGVPSLKELSAHEAEVVCPSTG